MLETLGKLVTPHRRLVLALLVIGAVLRVLVNDVAAYSPADEAHYVDITRWLTRDGWSAYPQFVSTYLDRQALWLSPTPLRWGHFSLTTLACTLQAPCDGRTLAWLSTLAGIASLALTYALGSRLVGRGAALLATAFSIVSPLQLALGRRALQDQVYCAAFLAAFLSLVHLLDADPHEPRSAPYRRMGWFVLASTFAFSVKEAFAFPYAAFVALYLFASSHRGPKLRDAALFLLPPLLFCAGFVLVGQNPSALYDLVRLNEASFASDYSIQYQSGPAHRPMFDLFLLAPIVCLLATSALAKMTERLRTGGRERWLAGFLIMALAAFMGLPKNLRFMVILDPVLRLLAAWIVVNHPWFVRATRAGQSVLFAFFVAINAAVEFSLFDTIFRQRNIYDPTTYDILHALGAIPRTFAGAQTNRWPAFFLALAGSVAIVLGVRRSSMTEKTDSEPRSASRLSPTLAIGIGIAALVAAFFAGRMSVRDDGSKPAITTPSASTNAARDPMAEGLDALYTKRDAARAVARFREVLAAEPNHYGATYQLATALEQAGDRPAARAMWTKMLKLSEASADEATITHARGRIAALTPALPQALPQAPAAEDPAGAEMRLGLAELYEKKDPAAAVKHFREVLAKNPTHYGATFQLATALEQSGKRDEAKPLWTKTLEMAEAMGDTQSAAIARKHLGKTN